MEYDANRSPSSDPIKESVAGSLELGPSIRGSVATYGPEVKLAARLDANCQKNSLMLRIPGNRIALSPSLIITKDDIREMAKRIRASLDDTYAELRAAGL